MTFKDLVRHHFEFTFEKEAWQPPLASAIEGLSARQAVWKPGPQRHSIWQIVCHVIHWKRAFKQAWNGENPDYDEYERTDWKDIAEIDEEAWQADVRDLHAISMELKRRLEGTAVEDLEQPFPGETRLNAAQRLLRMATHDIYHSGQIRYIRALQGV